MTARNPTQEYLNMVETEVAPLVDLLVLINDYAGLLGGPLAAQLDTLVRHRLACLVDQAAFAEARTIGGDPR